MLLLVEVDLKLAILHVWVEIGKGVGRGGIRTLLNSESMSFGIVRWSRASANDYHLHLDGCSDLD